VIDINTALDEMESLFSWGFEEKNVKEYHRLHHAVVESKGHITQEHHSRILDIAIGALAKGVSKLARYPSIIGFTSLLYDSGYRSNEWEEKARHICPSDSKVLGVMFHLVVEFLKRNCILRPNETVELIEYGDFVIGRLSGRIREGVVFTTQERLFSVGKDHRHELANHILYPDRAKHRYYGSMDYIDFEAGDRVVFGRAILSRRIKITKKSLRYARTHPRRIYGLGVKLDPAWNIRTGECDISIYLEPFRHSERRMLKERYMKLLEEIQRGIASAVSRE